MFFKRWMVVALAILLAIGIFSAMSAAGQRDAWMQGYLAGRLSTGADGGAALAPYMMPGGAFGPRYGGFPFGLLIWPGFLLLGLFLISRRLHYWKGQAGGPDEWHERMRQRAEQWHERHQGRPREQDDDKEQRMI